MLQLRPTCEHCDTPLAPESPEARICSYECTFCSACVEHVLENVCPNCGGGFTARPIRPAKDRVDGNYLGNHPASGERVYRPVDPAAHAERIARIKHLPPEQR